SSPTAASATRRSSSGCLPRTSGCPGAARSAPSAPAPRPRCAAAPWRRPCSRAPLRRAAAPFASGAARGGPVDELGEDLAGLVRDPLRLGQRLSGGFGPLGDVGLDPLQRAGVDEQPAQLVDLLLRQVRRPEPLLQAIGVGRGRPGEGPCDEHGPLALAQVVAGGLAGDLGITEDAEHVVAQLEGLTERESVAGERRQVLLARVAGGGADEQRVLDGVLGALVADDVAGAVGALLV